MEKKEKKTNWLEVIAFALLLLLAVNAVLHIVPSYVYLEAAIIMVAVALEVYSHFLIRSE